jgi:hypothetical protein
MAMPSLKRGKDNAIGVVLPMTTGDGGGTEQRHIPVVYPLTPAYPVSSDGTDATPVTATSGNVANAIATATIPAVVGKTAFISGFTISGAGATAALVVNPTVTGIISGTKTYTYAAVAGVGLINQVLDVQFCPPIPASAVNTAIAVACPALGAGNTNNTVNAYGFYI